MEYRRLRAGANTHDLQLPDWGPYTKKYIGISHIPDVKRGLRFDLSVFPGFYRRKVDVPNVMWESGYHPWEAATNLSYFCHRHELEWKDQVYCDISFSELPGNARLIRCECVNRTDQPQNLVLHYMASLSFPPLRIYSQEAIQPCTVKPPAGAIWVDALDYEDLRFLTARPTDSLVTDGLYRGEIRGHGFVNGSGVGMGFGQEMGDWVSYRFVVPEQINDAVLLFRYRMSKGDSLFFWLEGSMNSQIQFTGSDDFQSMSTPVGDLPRGEYTLRLTSLGGKSIELDGFAVVSAQEAPQVQFEPVIWVPQPEIIAGPLPNSRLLKYPDVGNYYGIFWDYDQYQVREFLTDELDRFMRHTVHNHVSTVLQASGNGHFTNVFLRPIPLTPHSTRVLYGMVCSGCRAEAESAIKGFAAEPGRWEEAYRSARVQAVNLNTTPTGEKYLFSQERMAATVLTNVVYPVYVKRAYIRHNTPGRWWDCLYTWDSGFIGLGLAELDLERAIDCLNAYMTEPGDPQAAFVHHGSPVPTQMYLFLELWNRTQSPQLLAHFYPRLHQYHRFLAGRLGSSTTRQLKSNLLKTWDYFYNSGGWDDYPPQVYVHQNHLEKYVTPVINTAQTIRCAKILRMAASALGLAEDVTEYDGEIAMFGEALQRYSWDAESGYFGYVRHDEAGRPLGILRHESGLNYDMGLDGAYPLVAGVCTPEQQERLITHLISQGQMWCSIGLSTVDQSAPYFKEDGYWNGAVWMPHQWFFWKTMLDLGRPELALRIAQTALDLWKTEAETSYNCFEHFIVASARGAGWHHFGGLSSPVLCWFGAYHRPGRLTTGLDVWVAEEHFAEDNRSFTATLKRQQATVHPFAVIVTLNPEGQYRALWNGEEIAFQEPSPGVLEITLPGGSTEGRLAIN